MKIVRLSHSDIDRLMLDTIAEARANLTEALQLFLETAPADEVQRRRKSELYVTSIEIAVG